MRKTWITVLALGAGLALAAPAAAQSVALAVPTAAQSDSSEAYGEIGLIGRGAQVYANQCGRCHNMRSSVERTDAQWRVIVSHMRIRANMTRSEAEAVLAFLQATNVDGGAAATSTTEVPPPPEEIGERAGPDIELSELLALLRAMR